MTSAPRPVVGIVAGATLRDGRYPVFYAGEHYAAAAVSVCGATPIFFPGSPELLDIDALLGMVDGVILTGGRPNVHPENYGEAETEAHGPFDRRRDAVTLELARVCVARGAPILGVCRGYQEMAVAFGARLHPEIRDVDGRMNHRMPRKPDGSLYDDLDISFRLAHTVSLEAGSASAWLFGSETIEVNSLHGQAIWEPSAALIIDGYAPDGTPETLWVKDAPGFAFGVQWHAEYNAENDTANRRVFSAFGDAMRAHAAARRAA